MNSAKMLVRAVRGPVLLTTLGTLFAVDYFGPFRSTGPGRSC
jgi:hypothetical protein